MSMEITHCEKCKSISIEILEKDKLEKSGNETEHVKVKCLNCGNIFESNELTKAGEEMVKAGILWI